MPNRAAARYCRACRAALTAPVFSGSSRAAVSKASLLGIPGSFRRPPVAGNGHLYAMSRSGALFQLSPRAGAKAKQIAKLDSASAVFNRSAVVYTAGGHTGLPGGWLFLAASPASIDAISLVDGRVLKLYEPRSPETIAVNASEADGTAFKGLAANEEFVAFVVRAGGGDYTLTLRRLTQDEPAWKSVTLNGSAVAGPLLCGPVVVFCTEQQVGVYNHVSSKAAVMDLPGEFEPMLTPVSREVAIPPGGMPFAVRVRDPDMVSVCVVGEQDGYVGLLEVNLDGKDKPIFRRLPRGSSMATSADGTVCLSTLDEVEIFSPDCAFKRRIATQPGLPAFWEAPWLVSFGEVDFSEQHRLHIDAGSEPLELSFESMQCNRDTCCGIYLSGGDVLLAYLDIFAEVDADGLIFTHWSVES